MKVIDAGLLTTVQDLGRVGFQNDGVSPGGAMDRFAMRAANLLVGNRDDAATLEVTLKGPTLEFEHDALIAICGADLSPSIADVELPRWRAICVGEGSILRFGRRVWGCRAYLAIAGGIEVPEVLGSRSTYVSAGIGGFEGRPLARGDRLPVGSAPEWAAEVMVKARPRHGSFSLTDAGMSAEPYDVYKPRSVRFIKGPHFELLSSSDQQLFISQTFEVTPRSDRMGYRLAGPSLQSAGAGDMVSTGIVTGTVQLPPAGDPIVLMAEHPTAGGYPIVAVVATVDLPLVAQLRPGDPIRFTETSIEEAQLALRGREDKLEHAMNGVERDVSG